MWFYFKSIVSDGDIVSMWQMAKFGIYPEYSACHIEYAKGDLGYFKVRDMSTSALCLHQTNNPKDHCKSFLKYFFNIFKITIYIQGHFLYEVHYTLKTSMLVEEGDSI